MSPSRPLPLLATALLLLLPACLTPRALAESEGHKKLGAALLTEGDTAGAITEYRQSVEKNRWDAEAWHGLGMAHFAAGRHADAEKALKRAVQLHPEFSQAHLNLGSLYLEQRRWDDAIPELTKAAEDPEYRQPARARHNLGWAYYNQGDHAAARREYQQVLRGFPQFCPALLNLGMVDEAESKLQDALLRYREAAACDEKDLKSLLQLGMLEARLDLVSDACAHLALVEKADPYGALRDPAVDLLRRLDCASVTTR